MRENPNAKITSSHIARKAIIYVRQSSQQQVQNNLESKERQYKLKDRAQTLGWGESSCLVIDSDLGISGSRSENRPGFQKIISMVALQEVGIIFGIEVSRLARNCLDWYQLLEVSSTFGVLIGDEDGVYDPANFNDRLLLGLKGTISEVELQQIKSRMYKGLINKAKRGDLRKPLPIGFETDVSGIIRLTSNEAVQHSLKLVFQIFKKIKTVSGTLRELNRRNAELPYHPHERGLVGSLQWKPPVYSHLYSILTNECFAGIYAYGKRRVRYNPVLKRKTSTKLSKKEWEVFIPNHHEGYISLEEFEKNQKCIRGNSFIDRTAIGAPREGSNILQGIIYCQKCGRKMRSDYQEDYPSYCCEQENKQLGANKCTWVNSNRTDSKVEKLFLSVLNEGTVDLTFEMMKSQKEEVSAEKKRWQQKISRLEYDANLARRRYESVDPENRLVAANLEKDWNKKLFEFESAKQDFAVEFDSPAIKDISASEIKKKLGQTIELWKNNKISWPDKKQILRCLIERVTVSNESNTVFGQIVWHGGATSNFDYPKHLISNLEIFEHVTELSHSHTDFQIALILNEKGLKSASGKIWDGYRVFTFRRSNKIKSAFSNTEELRIPESPYYSANQAAKILNAVKKTVSYWAGIGLLENIQEGKQKKRWIKLTTEDILNFNGSQKPMESDVLLSSVVDSSEYHQLKEKISQLRKNGGIFFRARDNCGLHFYYRINRR